MPKIKNLAELENYRNSVRIKDEREKIEISVCMGTGCTAKGGNEIYKALNEALGEIQEQDVNVALRHTGCHGFCERGPIVTISPGDIFYSDVELNDIPEIIRDTVLRGIVVERLLYEDPKTGERMKSSADVPF